MASNTAAQAGTASNTAAQAGMASNTAAQAETATNTAAQQPEVPLVALFGVRNHSPTPPTAFKTNGTDRFKAREAGYLGGVVFAQIRAAGYTVESVKRPDCLSV